MNRFHYLISQVVGTIDIDYKAELSYQGNWARVWFRPQLLFLQLLTILAHFIENHILA